MFLCFGEIKPFLWLWRKTNKRRSLTLALNNTINLSLIEWLTLLLSDAPSRESKGHPSVRTPPLPVATTWQPAHVWEAISFRK